MQTIETMDERAVTIPGTMMAAAINRFGGIEEIQTQELPVPEIDADEILVRVHTAGVGVWDPYEREGRFQNMMEGAPHFPYILGSDGAGTVVAVGGQVRRFKIGDRIYGFTFLSPKGGFYAEYAAVKADNASLVPGKLTLEQAGAMPIDAITALRGLDDTIGLKEGDSLLIFGASGGIGHIAVQLAKRIGARVLAVASGDDGVSLVKRLGADVSVDGKRGDVAKAVRNFAPDGLDAALVLTSSKGLNEVIALIRPGGSIAFPHGVEPQPTAPSGVTCQGYDGMPDPAAIVKLNRLINYGPFEVTVARTFPLTRANDAQKALEQHYLGKLALDVAPL